MSSSIFAGITAAKVQARWDAGQGGKMEIQREMQREVCQDVVLDELANERISHELAQVLSWLIERRT